MPDPSGPDQRCAVRSATAIAAGGMVLCVVALLCFAAIQYAIPPVYSVHSQWGLNPPGAWHFARTLFGQEIEPWEPERFILWFRALCVIGFAGYGLAVAGVMGGGRLPPRVVLPVILALAVILALFCPPTLSNDSYAYVGYARMHVVHGLNPYVHAPRVLAEAGDPIAEYLSWNEPSVYGPAWLLLSFGLIAEMPAEQLWWQVVAMKLLGALALVGAAWAGKGVAERFKRGTGDVTLLAIGLNPLFFLEGPCSGHNDLLMMALVLVSVRAFLERRLWLAGLALGLAAGIKFVPLALLPWMILESCRGLDWSRRIRNGAVLSVLALTPLTLGYAPLWQGTETWQALRNRSRIGMSEAELTREASLRRSLQEWHVPESAVAGLLALERQWPVVLLYVALCWWLWQRPGAGGWLDAWVILAIAANVCSMGIWFAWYWLWPCAIALTRWDRARLGVSAGCACVALGLTWRYVVLS